MALRMGLDLSRLPDKSGSEFNTILSTIPARPMVSEEEWAAIKAHYLTSAPDSLISKLPTFAATLRQFATSAIALPIGDASRLTLVAQSEEDKHFRIGSRNGKLYTTDASFEIQDSLDLNSPPSDIIFNDGQVLLSCMGIMDPNDRPAGSVIQLDVIQKEISMLIDSIKRPVDVAKADLNRDGQEDLVVSAFGDFTGGLHVFEKHDKGYRQHVLHTLPGARKAILRDVTEDGLPDILALFAQGDEHIALFTNRGNFRFSYQILLKFSPVYGSSYFELHDFNTDGHPDILYTNGDNADYSPILKPYHGVRIFLNDGHNKFSESWHHPMHGASMAKAVDFDQDGDLDIAAISFFPDFDNHPEHGFIYFENQNGKFIPHATTMAAAGRWITMEITDIDEDGDEDIVLAALNFPTGVPENLLVNWKKNPVSLLVLKNNLK